MPEYIEKLRVTVRVSRPGEPPVEGVLSLLPASPFHGGPETLLELLGPSSGFIPFERVSDDTVLLISRTDIQWVMADLRVAPELVRPRTFRYTREERVHVRLRGGEELDGVIQMELPESINRTSDYLNGPERFFPLTTRQGVFLIQKTEVREVLLSNSSPSPLPDAAAH